jgi:hypothetical protein
LREALENLCVVFEEELERQETVLRLCQLQETAIRGRDPQRLAELTASLNLVLQEAAAAEAGRHRAARAVVEGLGLDAAQHTLSAVVAAAPQPWQARLAELQARLREVMAASALATKQNGRVMRRLLSTCNETLRALQGGEASPGYSTAGAPLAPAHRSAALLNQAG